MISLQFVVTEKIFMILNTKYFDTNLFRFIHTASIGTAWSKTETLVKQILTHNKNFKNIQKA